MVRTLARVHLLVATVALLAGLWADTAAAQAISVGKGVLTLELGQATVPFGNIATDVANPGSPIEQSNLHSTAFRFMAGYHFAEQLSVEVGLAHLGSTTSRVPYNGTDFLSVQASLLAIEGDLVANIPIASSARVDLTIGAAETGLSTTTSTEDGSALPAGQQGSDSVRRVGLTAGADIEWRLGDVSSVILGYHLYSRVGSPVLRDSASGNVTALFAGLKFEF